jgi:NAD(P)H-flavin reductase
VTTKTLIAEVTSLPGDVIRLSIPNTTTSGSPAPGFSHQPGQYAFLRIKEVSATEYHPFSFSSAPSQGATTIHIRELGKYLLILCCYAMAGSTLSEAQRFIYLSAVHYTTSYCLIILGDWTKRLGALTRAHYRATPEVPLRLQVMLDGPYGTHKVDLESSEYEVFLLISGGIGITPVQSVYHHLIAQVSQQGRPMKKVLFIWSVRDRVLIDSMTPDMLESNKRAVQHTSSSSSSTGDVTPLSFQPPMEANAPDLFNDRKAPPTDATAQNKSKFIQDIYDNKIFHNQFYLTKSRDPSEFEEAGIVPDQQPWLHFGRPDLSVIFQETAKMVVASTGSLLKQPRVAVCVCGPQGMVDMVRDLCITTRNVAEGGSVAFDCHAEVFDF